MQSCDGKLAFATHGRRGRASEIGWGARPGWLGLRGGRRSSFNSRRIHEPAAFRPVQLAIAVRPSGEESSSVGAGTEAETDAPAAAAAGRRYILTSCRYIHAFLFLSYYRADRVYATHTRHNPVYIRTGYMYRTGMCKLVVVPPSLLRLVSWRPIIRSASH